MKQSLTLYLGIIFVLFSCKTSQTPAGNETGQEPCVSNTQESCVCPTHSEPVCGCDNKTYLNPCHANCSNVTYVAGKCKDKNKK